MKPMERIAIIIATTIAIIIINQGDQATKQAGKQTNKQTNQQISDAGQCLQTQIVLVRAQLPRCHHLMLLL